MQIVNWFNAHAAELAVLLSILTALLRALWHALGDDASKRWPWLRSAVEAVGSISPDLVRFGTQLAKLFGLRVPAAAAESAARDAELQALRSTVARQASDLSLAQRALAAAGVRQTAPTVSA